MKKLSILLFLFIFLTGCTKMPKKPDNLLDEIKQRDKIIVGIKTDSKPFCFMEDDKITGFDADIARHIAENLFNDEADEHIIFVKLKPQERISALNTGRVDIVIATLSINEKRRGVIDFSKPYYLTGQALMVPKKAKINSIEQLNNKNIGAVPGTTGERTIRLLAPNATIIGAISYDNAYELLKQGAVQAILADESLLYGLLENGGDYKILPMRYTKEYYAIGLRQGEENKSLKEYLDAIITDMQKTGKLNQLKKKWLPLTFLKQVS